MTLENLIEEVRTVFPNVGVMRIIKTADRAQKILCEDTHCLMGIAELTDPTSYVAWGIPDDFVALDRIRVYDSSNDPVYLGEDNLKYKVEDGYIIFYATTSTTISTLPSNYTTVNAHYFKRPATLDDIDDTFDIDEAFHEALLAKVFERMHAMNLTPISAEGEVVRMGINTPILRYWASQYNDRKIAAMRKANMRGRKGKFRIQPYYHGGNMQVVEYTQSGASGSTLLNPSIQLLSVSADTSTVIQAGRQIDSFTYVPVSGTATTIKVGTSDGGEEVQIGLSISAGEPTVVSIDTLLSEDNNTTIYFTSSAWNATYNIYINTRQIT
jgi:hypothetical protein